MTDDVSPEVDEQVSNLMETEVEALEAVMEAQATNDVTAVLEAEEVLDAVMEENAIIEVRIS